MRDQRAVEAIRRTLKPLSGEDTDYDPLMALVGDKRFVLLGEASHGTHEFYDVRQRITRRLIREKGFHAVAVEADWPDAYRVNRYVRWESADRNADQALGDFKRFPLWMWRNVVVRSFVEWLRDENASRTPRVGFYGLDLYSLNASVQEVLRYLEEVDPEAAKRARYRYACFEDFGEEPQEYGFAASVGVVESCEDAVIAQLKELQRRASEYAQRDGLIAADRFFYAEQNARLVKNAEEYYRAMFRGRTSSWNLRDKHMTDTLDALAEHLDREVGRSKIVVWAHNSHLGDARATERTDRSEWNVGQLVRERHGTDAVLIGFTTYTGTVTAASDWGKPYERKRVRPGLPGSYEELFHQVPDPNFLVLTQSDSDLREVLRVPPRLERAIGVIYRPETERQSHYFHAQIADQFDAVIHLDETSALQALDPVSERVREEVPETFPSGV
ncbi:MAG TPA: erythromycin esterase family protein [Bryobacteraceae bacterium]|nr:erythromycin esterase family protein [Bryobacteraceae bacterium]